MIDTPQVVQTTAQTAAVIHLRIAREEMPNVMGAAINEVLGALKAQGVAPVGPLFCHHLVMQKGLFDFEVGFGCTAVVKASGRVKPSSLPAVRVARATYTGGYEGLHGAWVAFGEWLTKQGLTPRGDLWESYVYGPESSQDPATWRTELNQPLV